MAINFPNSPTAGDSHSEAGINWVYDGEKWVAQSEATFWARAGSTLSPSTAGDNISTTGDLTAADATVDTLTSNGLISGPMATFTGDVGIGTTTPSAYAETRGIAITGSNRAGLPTYTGQSGTDTTGFMNMYANSSDGFNRFFDIGTVGDPNGAGSNIRFLTQEGSGSGNSAEERMAITNTGRVNIVSSYTTGSPQLYVENAASASGQQGVQVKLSSSSDNTSSFIFIGSSNGNRVYIYGNGNIANANNAYGSISDIKLKKDIVDASSQWDDIKRLRVRNYSFIEGRPHRQIGVVAQEIETVSPGLVTESPDRDAEGNDLGTVTKSVNYSVLYMKAVKALQEAMERIEALEAEVQALKGGI